MKIHRLIHTLSPGVAPEAEGELAALRLLALIATVGWQQAAHQLGVLAHAHIEGCDDLQDGVIAHWRAGLFCILHLDRLAYLSLSKDIHAQIR